MMPIQGVEPVRDSCIGDGTIGRGLNALHDIARAGGPGNVSPNRGSPCKGRTWFVTPLQGLG